ncbi:hypothetical protein IMZ48_32075, partial [Candidatus Bathyarchaeota archaeon]|nr:hypothetical protein [Candidatus Bathyarchaeota archaeon]
MEGLIKQAFRVVDVIGPVVQGGHFELFRPNGEIILPQVWESLVQPGLKMMMVMCKSEERVVALHDFVSERSGELSFREGDSIKIVRDTAKEHWWVGELRGVQGRFPAYYCTTMADGVPDGMPRGQNYYKPEQRVVALHDFVADRSGDLSFREGDTIKIVKGTGTKHW